MSLASVTSALTRDKEKTVVCFVLALCYLVVATCAVAQFVRTHRRLSKALTKQKLFFTFTAVTALARLGLMITIPFSGEPLLLSYYRKILLTVLNNLPGLLFFSTYNLLIAYWAEILDRVQNPPVFRGRKRPYLRRGDRTLDDMGYQVRQAVELQEPLDTVDA